MDPVPASVSNPVKEPTVPFNKLTFSISVNTSVDPLTGILSACGGYSVNRGRKFEDGTWELDRHNSPDGKPPVTYVEVPDWFALMAEQAALGNMGIYNAFVALGIAVAEMNTVKGSV